MRQRPLWSDWGTTSAAVASLGVWQSEPLRRGCFAGQHLVVEVFLRVLADHRTTKRLAGAQEAVMHHDELYAALAQRVLGDVKG